MCAGVYEPGVEIALSSERSSRKDIPAHPATCPVTLTHTNTHGHTHTVLGSSSSQRRNNHSFSCLVRGFQTPSLSFSGPILDFFYISLDFSLSIMRGYIV